MRFLKLKIGAKLVREGFLKGGPYGVLFSGHFQVSKIRDLEISKIFEFSKRVHLDFNFRGVNLTRPRLAWSLKGPGQNFHFENFEKGYLDARFQDWAWEI